MALSPHLTTLITAPKTIAVVGLSDKPDRPSYQVAEYLLKHGFTIIPVNPTIPTTLGLHSYPSLSVIPNPQQIDIVDIFRQSEAVPEIVEEVLALDIKPLIWMQEGVASPRAAELAIQHGLPVMMNQCLKKTHAQLNEH